MKNFDFKIYESMQYGADDAEWLEMMDKCHKDYLLCKSAFSRKFIKWYENGWFHDAHLLKVESKYGKDGAWEINLVLQCRDDKYWNLSFHNVLDFRIHIAGEKNCKDNYEECLYEEFYRFDKNTKDIVMEFFTDQYTEFYIKFKKLTISSLKNEMETSRRISIQ